MPVAPKERFVIVLAGWVDPNGEFGSTGEERVAVPRVPVAWGVCSAVEAVGLHSWARLWPPGGMLPSGVVARGTSGGV